MTPMTEPVCAEKIQCTWASNQAPKSLSEEHCTWVSPTFMSRTPGTFTIANLVTLTGALTLSLLVESEDNILYAFAMVSVRVDRSPHEWHQAALSLGWLSPFHRKPRA